MNTKLVARILLGAAYLLVAVFGFLVISQLAGCGLLEPKTVIDTVTIEKPVPVPCKIPPIDRPAMAVDQVRPADDMVTLNRAILSELEQRRAYELLLEAGVKACQ